MVVLVAILLITILDRCQWQFRIERREFSLPSRESRTYIVMDVNRVEIGPKPGQFLKLKRTLHLLKQQPLLWKEIWKTTLGKPRITAALADSCAYQRNLSVFWYILVTLSSLELDLIWWRRKSDNYDPRFWRISKFSWCRLCPDERIFVSLKIHKSSLNAFWYGKLWAAVTWVLQYWYNEIDLNEKLIERILYQEVVGCLLWIYTREATFLR